MLTVHFKERLIKTTQKSQSQKKNKHKLQIKLNKKNKIKVEFQIDIQLIESTTNADFIEHNNGNNIAWNIFGDKKKCVILDILQSNQSQSNQIYRNQQFSIQQSHHKHSFLNNPNSVHTWI